MSKKDGKGQGRARDGLEGEGREGITNARARASFLLTTEGDRSRFSEEELTGTERGEFGVEAMGV